jgi:hypothetical protein
MVESSFRAAIVLALVGGPSLSACSSAEPGQPRAGQGGTGTATGGTASAGGAGAAGAMGVAGAGGITIGGCTETCVAPRTCSTGSSVCLDPGTCLVDGDCATGHQCDVTSGSCAIGGDCGQVAFQLEQVASNVLILLDRSGSMDDDAGGETRWNVARSAIDEVTRQWGGKLRFGLATYSSCLAGGCSAGSIVTPIAADGAGAIESFLATTVGEGSSDGTQKNDDGKIRYLCDSDDPETSTGKSLAALVGEPSLLDAGRANAVILLTDGAENDDCAGECDGPCGAKRLLNQTPPVKTYVIGLGVNADDVDAIAKAGGTSTSISAKNLADLSLAFSQVAATVATCDYVLSGVPPNTSDLYVFFDDNPTAIPADVGEGWSYDASTNHFTINGASCDRVKSGQVKDIDVVFGCPRPVIE